MTRRAGPEAGRARPCPPALAGDALRRATRTVARVEAAIALLVGQQRPVSLRAIAAATAMLDPELPPLAASTITRNPIAYQRYLAARPPSITRRRRRPRTTDRWLERKPKAELIDLIHGYRDTVAHLERCLARLVFAGQDGPEG